MNPEDNNALLKEAIETLHELSLVLVKASERISQLEERISNIERSLSIIGSQPSLFN
jgi:methyl-accepting chemotaxis protein